MDMDWTPSDFALVLNFGLALILALYFGLGRPRTWYRDRLGWVIFSYALGTVAFVGLIVYGIVFGQKVPEPIRLLVGVGFAVALSLKIYAIRSERVKGRIAGESSATERNPMSTKSAQAEAVKSATDIWYKGKRVLRTAFSTLLTILPIAPQVIAIVNGQWETPWLAAVGVQAIALNSVITRIMAIPTVNAWLIKVGLGSVPKDALIVEPAAHTRGATTVTVQPDPKAVGE